MAFTYVYQLVSLKDPGRHYTGMTSDLQDRIARHNRRRCQAVKCSIFLLQKSGHQDYRDGFDALEFVT
jgi:predicted GIY-YIG superfamily endonuclease